MYGNAFSSSSQPLLGRDLRKARVNQRFNDIAESERLLLELASAEPTMQQCFKIIESTCLSQGIYCRIDGRAANAMFLDHLDEFYMPFCRAALRAMCVYGFVPWKTRKLRSGDIVPEVLPAGTFSWTTEIYRKDKRPLASYNDDETLTVNYRINPNGNAAFKEEEVHIYVYTAPGLEIMNNSILYATVPSPLAHILTDYKALRQGQLRRSHADAWNTTAKIITQFEPKLRVEDNPSQYLMDFVHEDYFVPPAGGHSMYPPLEAHNVWQREQTIRRQFDESVSTHHPEVFALPRDHTLAQQTHLEPCEDIVFLNDKFKRDVCALLGIPFELISGRDSSKSATGGSESVRKSMASGRLFSTNMQDFCKHLQRLLRQVYRHIYHKKVRAVGSDGAAAEKKDSADKEQKKEEEEDVTFVLVPMPRLEIESIADLKVLHEIGALTPDMSLHMSKTLLGENHAMAKRQKVQQHTGGSGGGGDDEGQGNSAAGGPVMTMMQQGSAKNNSNTKKDHDDPQKSKKKQKEDK